MPTLTALALLTLAAATSPQSALPFAKIGQTSQVEVSVGKLNDLGLPWHGIVAESGDSMLVTAENPGERGWDHWVVDLRSGDQVRQILCAAAQVQGRTMLLTLPQALRLHAVPFRLRSQYSSERNDEPGGDGSDFATHMTEAVPITAPDANNWVIQWAPTYTKPLHPTFRVNFDSVIQKRLVALIDPRQPEPPKVLRESTPALFYVTGDTSWDAKARTLVLTDVRHYVGRFEVWRTMFDFRHDAVRHKRIGWLPDRSREGRLHVSGVSASGSLALLSGTRPMPSGKGYWGITFLCRSHRLTELNAPVNAFLWRNRVLGLRQAAVTDTTQEILEYADDAWQQVATGWQWRGQNADGSRVIALEQRTGKMYLMTFN